MNEEFAVTKNSSEAEIKGLIEAMANLWYGWPLPSDAFTRADAEVRELLAAGATYHSVGGWS